MMIFIDFEKAFDSIEWCFLCKCLETFNFGPEFIKWAKTFYKNVSTLQNIYLSLLNLNSKFFSHFFAKIHLGYYDTLSWVFVFFIYSCANEIFDGWLENSEIKRII